MAEFDMKNLERASQRDRRDTEKDAQAGLEVDARKRLRSGKVKPLFLRQTAEGRERIMRLAEALSAGKNSPVTLAETVELALDALEEKLKGGSK